MTDELISKTDVVKIVKSVLSPASSLTNVARARRQMLDQIYELESKPEPHWIPVTEQEPKESGKYLVTAIISFIPDHVDDPDTVEAVTTANYLADIRGSIKWWGNNVEKVLAWMPIPEPFEGVTE